MLRNKIGMAVSAMALGLAVPASAAEIGSTVTLGYGSTGLPAGLGNLNTYSIDSSTSFRFSNGVALGFDLGFTKFDPSDADESVNLLTAALKGSYTFDGGFSAGAYIETASFSVDGLGGFLGDDNIGLTSYGLTAGYRTGNLNIIGFYGISKTDPELPPDVDITDFGVNVGYVLSDDVTLAGNFVRSRVSASGDSLNVDVFEVAGTYKIGPQFALHGGVSMARTDLMGTTLSIPTYALGMTYTLDAVGSMASPTLGVELARSELRVDGDKLGDIDTVRLSLTVPLSGKGAKLPLNSVASSIQKPRHNALSSMVLSAF